jgi:phosphate acetyltransferase
MSNFAAYGPFAIGMAKPVNDLSRGATLEDVIGLSYITALQSL